LFLFVIERAKINFFCSYRIFRQ